MKKRFWRLSLSFFLVLQFILKTTTKKLILKKKKKKKKKVINSLSAAEAKKKKRSDDQLLAEPVSELVPAAVPELLGQLRDVDSGGLGERRGPDADAVPGPAA